MQHSYWLDQHSPLIHFQHLQPGATLRASELRPRLDRYLAQQLGGWEKIPQTWLVGAGKTGHQAFDYRVRITPLGDPTTKPMEAKEHRGKWETGKYPGFFANTGKKSEAELINFADYAQVRVDFTCFKPELLKQIKDHFPRFLAKTNFGTRKSKGFGSFWLIDQHIEDHLPARTPYLYVQKGEYRDVADVIDYYYKRLKAGINYSHDRRSNQCDSSKYQKSFLFQYLAKHTGYTWEKRWLKEQFFSLTPSPDTKRFARAMLGMPGTLTFRRTDEPCNPSPSKIKVRNDLDIAISHRASRADREAGKVIERIPSPLTFKPTRCGNDAYKVFILVSPAPNLGLIAGRDFEFDGNGRKHTLPTPGSLIDYHDLLHEYHQELGSPFKALYFNGRTQSATIHHT